MGGRGVGEMWWSGSAASRSKCGTAGWGFPSFDPHNIIQHPSCKEEGRGPTWLLPPLPHQALPLVFPLPSVGRRMGGEEAERQWRALDRRMEPLQAGAALLPAAAIRGDAGIALTTAARYGPGLLKAGLVAGQLTGPFSGGLFGGAGSGLADARGIAKARSPLLVSSALQRHNTPPPLSKPTQPWWTRWSPTPGCAVSSTSSASSCRA